MSSLARGLGTRLLVTGATGFIGGASAARFQAMGSAVVTLCRTTDAAKRLRERGFDVRVGDLLDEQSLERACEGCDTVIHCAAVVGPGHDQREYQRVIAEGTSRLVAAARRQSVSRFVYVSSAAVYHKPRLVRARIELIGEETPIGNCGEPYGQAKADAERACRAAHDDRRFSVRILRPTSVYGEGDRGFLPFVVGALRAKKLALPGAGSGRCSVVHIDDVVDAITLSTTANQASGRAYNVTGPDELTWASFLDHVVAELGVPRPPSLRWPIAYAAGAACDAAKAVGLLRSAPVSRALVRFLLARRVFSVERAASELGFRARVRLESSLPRALADLSA